MTDRPLAYSRLIVGIILMVVAVLMFIANGGAFATAGAIAIGVLGLVSIAISRRS